MGRAGAAPSPAPAAVFTPAWDVTAEAPNAQPDRLAKLAQPASPGLVEFSSKWRDRLATSNSSQPALLEQFRRLAATLHQARRLNGLRTLMVTSATPGDGKTLTAVNLALVLAESYRAQVLLIDADLRRPSIPRVADLGEGSGLSDALRAATEQKLALLKVVPGLTLLPAGHAIANSIEALTSPRMRQILDEAEATFDWVILDAPPMGATADARLLSQMVGGTLFVVRAGQTQCPDVQRAIESLGRENILGVVFNGVIDRQDGAYYGYGASHHNG